MTDRELLILRHALGTGDDGHHRSYRNHFNPGGNDIEVCNGLVERGMMIERMSWIEGGIFHVTQEGKKAAAPTTPKKRPTRYQRWLAIADAFSSWTFGDWLKAGCPGEKEAKP